MSRFIEAIKCGDKISKTTFCEVFQTTLDVVAINLI